VDVEEAVEVEKVGKYHTTDSAWVEGEPFLGVEGCSDGGAVGKHFGDGLDWTVQIKMLVVCKDVLIRIKGGHRSQQYVLVYGITRSSRKEERRGHRVRDLISKQG
jgi:hypothetical protein